MCINMCDIFYPEIGLILTLSATGISTESIESDFLESEHIESSYSKLSFKGWFLTDFLMLEISLGGFEEGSTPHSKFYKN